MGLDMYLYEISLPDRIEPNTYITNAHYHSLLKNYENLTFLSSAALTCDTIKKKSVRCFVVEKYYNEIKILSRGLTQFGIEAAKDTKWVRENIHSGGFSYGHNTSAYSYYINEENEELVHFFKVNSKHCKKIFLPEDPIAASNCKHIVLFDKHGYTVKIGITGETQLTIVIKEEGEYPCKKQPYVLSKMHVRYATVLNEIDYQRKGLNDIGWDLLPENCSYCDDKSRIRTLTEQGGLSKSFIENWTDHKTIFQAWW